MMRWQYLELKGLEIAKIIYVENDVFLDDVENDTNDVMKFVEVNNNHYWNLKSVLFAGR